MGATFQLQCGASLVVEHGPCGVQASVVAACGSVVAAPGFWCTDSVVVADGFSCSAACGILMDQGLNPCLLHWQADSLPVSHQGSLIAHFFLVQ